MTIVEFFKVFGFKTKELVNEEVEGQGNNQTHRNTTLTSTLSKRLT